MPPASIAWTSGPGVKYSCLKPSRRTSAGSKVPTRENAVSCSSPVTVNRWAEPSRPRVVATSRMIVVFETPGRPNSRIGFSAPRAANTIRNSLVRPTIPLGVDISYRRASGLPPAHAVGPGGHIAEHAAPTGNRTVPAEEAQRMPECQQQTVEDRLVQLSLELFDQARGCHVRARHDDCFGIGRVRLADQGSQGVGRNLGKIEV